MFFRSSGDRTFLERCDIKIKKSKIKLNFPTRNRAAIQSVQEIISNKEIFNYNSEKADRTFRDNLALSIDAKNVEVPQGKLR
jgi:hypothetical protein